MGEWKKKSIEQNPLFNFEDRKKGSSIEGIYLGTREVMIEGKVSLMHAIETKKGVFDFWGTGHLNFLLKDIDKKTELKVVYMGTEKIKTKKYGKKETHIFEVYTK